MDDQPGKKENNCQVMYMLGSKITNYVIYELFLRWFVYVDHMFDLMPSSCYTWWSTWNEMKSLLASKNISTMNIMKIDYDTID